MGNNTREIRRRIRSVANIRQITKAMEVTSAVKMRKAQLAAQASRPYSKLSSELLKNLVAKVNLPEHPLLKRVMPDKSKKAKRILAVLITSDRGLAGAFNSNVTHRAVELLKQEGQEKFDFITVGKKGSDFARRTGLNITAAFPGKDKAISISDAKPIAQLAIDGFLKNQYEKVFVIYSDFISTLVQKPNILQILPFSSEADTKGFEDFKFEPSADEVLENLIIRVIEFAVFQSLVEAAASEHSARMVAMRNANEAAGDLIDDLSLSYNQARQAGITRELSEISAAKLAMEG